jgi:signal transduction histidine kinase
MFNNKFRQRLNSLFADINRLSADPACDTAVIKRDLEALRARLCKLETEFTESEKHPPVVVENISSAPLRNGNDVKTRPDNLVLYEKERVAYTYCVDEPESFPISAQDVSLSAHAITAPLTASGQTIGDLEIESPTERSWTPEETNLANAVAQQASLQIQNLRLLAATERARAEAEIATRRFMHEGWDSYLDAIHQNEQIGFAYDQTSVKPYIEKLPLNSGFHEPMAVMDEQVGALYIKADPSHPLTDDDKEMMAAVANQVAQQVENIRLLADASRARAEAEEATRRLTRDTWEAYTADQDETALGFVYDLNKVSALGKTPIPEKMNFTQPLIVHGEPIGQLAVAGWKDIPPEAAYLASSIASQVSVHLETLRLAEELKKRADELDTLNQVIATATQTLDLNTLLETVLDKVLTATNFSAGLISLFNPVTNVLDIGAIKNMPPLIHERLKTKGLEGSLCAYVADTKQRMSIEDLEDGGPVDVRGLIANGLRSYLGVPIIGKGRILGTLCLFNIEPRENKDTLLLLVDSMANQIGIAIENARLYSEQSATVAQLRELDRLKTAFLANMSHELRTPLNSILGFSDVILEQIDGPLTAPMKNDLQLIQRNGQHLLHLINDVLDMAKIEAGRINLAPERFLVHEIFDEVLSITSTMASEKNLSLFVEADSDKDVEIFADRTRLRQVMINLINNSIKFTEKGRIAIRASRQGTENILIRVRDTGVGIPSDKLEAIFVEFAQIDTSSTRKAGGTGLGLPISRRLIELHGGRLWAESNGIPGEGSTFYVELPIEALITEPIEKKEK